MIGTMVGSYKITEKIGEGGMGAVFRGIDVMLEREVAIKMLRPELASQPQVVERFRSEAVTLAKLNHPNIATLYSFLRQGDHFFMVMEFVRGETLDDVIRRLGAMPVEHATTLFCQALEGIEHAHKMGIIHRDIKPANMMLAMDGALKVMDFGIARVLGTARLTRQGSVVGTIEYMSPEQVRGEEGDARSDIYSLGILFYEMLTGRVPFHSTSEFALMKAQIEDPPPPPRAFAPHIPIQIEQAIMRSLAKKPEARFQSGGEFREAVMRKTTTASRPIQAAPLPVASQPAASPSTQHGTIQFGTVGTPSGSAPTPAPSGEHLKETRLGGNPTLPMAYPNQAKETRLPDPVPQAYATRPEQYYQAAPQQPSFFARLNWKHYAGAVAILLALAIVPFAIVAGLKRSQADAPPAEQLNTAPAQAEEQIAPPSEPQNQITPLPSQEAVTPVDPANPGSTKPRPRDGAEDRAEQPPTTEPAPPSDTTAPATPPVKSETVAPPKEPEKSEVAKKEESKKEEEKKEKKKGGIGGFFKKVFGGGDDKKEVKKKKP
ncbi:MAG: protein kinase [Acidobacteriota bacterium]